MAKHLMIESVELDQFIEELVARLLAVMETSQVDSQKSPVVDINGLQKILPLSRSSIERGVRDGTIPCLRYGSRVMFEVREVIDALAVPSKKEKEAGS